ncbi:MAG: hypothetical protein WCK31_02305 [bacterium]
MFAEGNKTFLKTIKQFESQYIYPKIEAQLQENNPFYNVADYLMMLAACTDICKVISTNNKYIVATPIQLSNREIDRKTAIMFSKNEVEDTGLDILKLYYNTNSNYLRSTASCIPDSITNTAIEFGLLRRTDFTETYNQMGTILFKLGGFVLNPQDSNLMTLSEYFGIQKKEYEEIFECNDSID